MNADDPALASTTVDFSTPSGPVRAHRDGEVLRARGIPYARAGRFEAPVTADDRSGLFDAAHPAPACPQGPVPFLDEVLGTRSGELPADEHCLNLSVTLPADRREGERLPVMVWIHGGSYVSGAGDLAIMDARALVGEQRVIVVSVTYRLGLFGYLGSDAASGAGAQVASGAGVPVGSAAGEQAASGAGAQAAPGSGARAGAPARLANLGLLDQLEALRWVRRNIAAFGGDPDAVTAFGQSAGGDAVAHLMALPEAPSLFRRAIVQSAPLGISRGRAAMSTAMNAALERELARGTTPLLDRSVDDILSLQESVATSAARFGLAGGMPFGTQYGHAPLPPEDAVDDAWNRTAPAIELLIGHTSEEARLFVPRVPAIRRLAEVPVLGAVARRILVSIATAAVYGRSARRFAARHTRAGGSARRYLIDWSVPGNPYGSAHTIDLPLLFGDEATWRHAALVAGASWPDLDSRGRAVRAAWAAFARGDLPPAGVRIPHTLRIRPA